VTPPVATRAGPEQSSSTRAPADLVRGAPAVLAQVPRPDRDASVVMLSNLTAGGLGAVQAEWGVDGGAVVLSGKVPFADLTGRAGFRSDGTLDGTVQMRARVALLGLNLGEATWSVDGWTPESPLAAPSITLRGTTVAVDLRTLPNGVVWAAGTGIDCSQSGQSAVINLPTAAAPAGEPLSPRIAEVYRGLLDTDLTQIRVHADSQVADAPAFVTDSHLFFAPGIYGVDAPEPLRILDAAIRAALVGLAGAVTGEAAPVASEPAPPSPAAPAADTTVVPADVPESSGPAPTAEPTPPDTAGVAGESADQATAAVGTGEAVPAAGGAAEQAAPAVELIMPEPPTTLTPAAAARGGGVAGGAGGAARAATNLPSADADVADSRGAVTEPVAETAARAREELAAELGERPAPSPEIVALCERIRTAIRENRPEDEDQLLATDPTHEAQQAGGTITGSVEGQAQQVAGSYDAMGSPPAGTPALTPSPVPEQSPTSPGMGVDAASAAPDPIPPENTTLDADVAATDQKIADSGIDTRVTREIPDGPFAQARDARTQLGEAAQRTPQQIAAEQQQAIDSAQADMAQLQLQAVAAMRGARSGAVGGVGTGQTGMVSHEENTREGVSRHAQQIFDDAQRSVEALLEPLSRTAIARWEAGLTRLSQDFHDSLDRVKRWIDERHSGVGGTILAIGDYIAGLPGWVTDEYNRAEREFGDGVCDLLTDISSDVNGVIAAAQALIQHARTDIDAAFTAMEAEFPEWAAQERARFGGMLDGLSNRVNEAQTSFVRDVSARAVTAVNQVHAEAQALRDAAGGLVGQVLAAIEEFIDDPVKAIINGLLRLVGIPPGAFWALIARIEQVISDIADDPENFINNLVAGVKQGFQGFFDNFGTHVLNGFWNWLFSGLETPIAMPRDFSARSLFTFALELMGITWPRIREILVRHIGPTAVEVIEAAWQLISVLIERGPEGIVEMIKEQLSPENIVGMILEAAVQYLVETLIQQVIVRVIGMLNPAGAVAQAIDLIYQVCSWIFRNAARIFHFVEAVVNGMADVIAGNVGGLATKVEQALAMLIPPVIDFLAGLLHLGGLPGEVAEVITRLQTMVLGIVDRIIGFLAERGRALLARMGIGGSPEEGGHNDDRELGTAVRFSAGGESHRLWFNVAGEDSTLMVASTPEPIANKVASWRSNLGQLPEDLRAPTEAKLNNLSAVADQANTEGDALARQFLEAQRDPNDTVEPPNDDALEARERAIAGMLDELFTIFGGHGSEANQLADIAANLPGHGRTELTSSTQRWAQHYSGPPKYVPAGATSEQSLWPDGSRLTSAATDAGVTYLSQPDVHRQLLPFFQAGSGERRADSAAFREYALGNNAPGAVRTGFLGAAGSRYADAMRTPPPASVDPIDRLTRGGQPLSTVIAAIAFSASPAGGAFAPVLDRAPGPDPALADVMGNLHLFNKAIARSPSVNGYTRSRLTWAWNHSETRSWLKDRFRTPGMHEWIPTNLIPDLLQAAYDAGGNEEQLVLAEKWLDFQNALRSQTRHVLWHFMPGPAGHVGSFSTDQAGRKGFGIDRSDQFHAWLRGIFEANRLQGPYAFAVAVMRDINVWVWNGSLAGIPADRLNEPITVWYNLEGVGRVAGMTIAELGAVQEGNFRQIIRDFEAALNSVGW